MKRYRDLGLGRKLLIHFTFLVVLVIPAFGVFSYVQAKKGIEDHIQLQTMALAEHTLDHVRFHLHNARNAARLTRRLATSEVVLRGECSKQMISYLKRMRRTYRQFTNVYVGWMTGKFCMDPPQKPEVALKYDPRVRPWFKRADREKSFGWTGVYVFASSKKPGVTASLPVLRADGKTRGVVGVDIDLSALSDFVRDLRKGRGGRAFIINHEGKLIAHPDQRRVNKLLTQEAEMAPVARRILAGGKGFLRYRHAGREYLLAYAPLPERRWFVGIALPMDPFLANIRRIGKATLVAVLGSLMLALLLSLVLSKRLTSAMDDLVAGTVRLAGGDYETRVEVRSEDEIGKLATSFNTMVEQIKEYQETQRLFYAELAEKKRLEDELELAKNIQMSLLPRKPPKIEGYTVAGACQEAREVGGDYYDFIPLSDGSTLVAVGDVSGKGLRAAIFMAISRAVLRAQEMSDLAPKALMTRINKLLLPDFHRDMFITVALVRLFPDGRVLYSSAGHDPIIRLRSDGSTEVFKTKGSPVAFLPDMLFQKRLEEMEFELESGDRLILYSDGFPEARNEEEEELGFEKLQEMAVQHAGKEAKEIVERLMEDTWKFIGEAEQHDDMTLVVIGRE